MPQSGTLNQTPWERSPRQAITGLFPQFSSRRACARNPHLGDNSVCSSARRSDYDGVRAKTGNSDLCRNVQSTQTRGKPQSGTQVRSPQIMSFEAAEEAQVQFLILGPNPTELVSIIPTCGWHIVCCSRAEVHLSHAGRLYFVWHWLS
jgi:hypothetical protein